MDGFVNKNERWLNKHIADKAPVIIIHACKFYVTAKNSFRKVFKFNKDFFLNNFELE
jgi:hypothetical protein